ncbi:BspA family leucine-rich repeat surface protein [Vibrio jasicida]|uniref:BspA family leucine-rich repeat surface protein n=1 Tax=Vibrio jasicida TaxID=766224 RepID=UPI0006986E4D|nr:BspA family leucine-rich repeat surface protein [Vibrio jasicida]
MRLNILTLSLLSVVSLNANAAFVAVLHNTISNQESTTPPPPADSCDGNELTRAQLDTLIANGDDVSNACTGKITDFSALFDFNTTFNQDISKWDVSSGTDFSDMFAYSVFNQDISNWDVSSGVNFASMFWNSSFNQDISKWNVSKGRDFSNIFQNASSFDQDISGWIIANEANVEYADFNSPIHNTAKSPFSAPKNACDTQPEITRVQLDAMIDNGNDVTNVCTRGITDFSNLFSNNRTFNQDISEWDVSNGTKFNGMFFNARSFNQNLSKWDVSKATDFSTMFSNAIVFNQDISGWNVSNAFMFQSIFNRASAFDQDISGWRIRQGANVSRADEESPIHNTAKSPF